MTKEYELFVINDLISPVQKSEAFNIIERKKNLNIFGTILYGAEVYNSRVNDVVEYSHAVSNVRKVMESGHWRYFVTITTLENAKGEELVAQINSGVDLSTDCDFVVIPAGNREMIASVINVHLRKLLI